MSIVVGDPTAWPLLIGPAASPLADSQVHPAPRARSRSNVAYDTPALLYDDLRRHARGDRLPLLGQWISPPFDPKPCPNPIAHPVEGGSANDYDYGAGDPCNNLDLTGTEIFDIKCKKGESVVGSFIVGTVDPSADIDISVERRKRTWGFLTRRWIQTEIFGEQTAGPGDRVHFSTINWDSKSEFLRLRIDIEAGFVFPGSLVWSCVPTDKWFV